MGEKEPSAAEARVPGCLALIPIAAILVCAAALRIVLLGLDLGTTLDSDEAVVGLMARHILGGEFPAFFYGQHYMGSLEAFLAAGVFGLAGPTTAALKTTVLLLGLGCVLAVYALSATLYDRQTGWVAALLTALPPVFLAVYGLKARGGYAETLLAGTLILWLAARIIETGSGVAQHRRFAILGLVAGLAWWTSSLSLVYLAAAGALLLSWNWRSALGGTRSLFPAFVVGSLPFWVHNVGHGFPSFGNLHWVGPAEAWGHLKGLISSAWPILAGGRGPWAEKSFFPRAGLVLLVIYAGAVAVYGAGIVAAWRRGTAGRSLAIARLGPAIASLLLLPLFCLSVYGAEVREPRYLFPLYSFLPLVLAVAIRRLPDSLRRRFGGLGRWGARSIAAALLVLVLAVQVYGCFAQDPTLMLPISGGKRVERSNAKLLGVLEDLWVTDIYTDYWVCYRLAFESDERIKCATYGEIVLDRYPAYVEQVRAAESPAFVLMGSVADEFQAMLTRRGVHYRKDKVGVYRIFSSLRPLGDIPSARYPFRDASP